MDVRKPLRTSWCSWQADSNVCAPHAPFWMSCNEVALAIILQEQICGYKAEESGVCKKIAGFAPRQLWAAKGQMPKG